MWVSVYYYWGGKFIYIFTMAFIILSMVLVYLYTVSTVTPQPIPNVPKFEIGRNIGPYALYIRNNAVYVRKGDLGYSGVDGRVPLKLNEEDEYDGPAVMYMNFSPKSGKSFLWTFDKVIKMKVLAGDWTQNISYLPFVPREVGLALTNENNQVEKEPFMSR